MEKGGVAEGIDLINVRIRSPDGYQLSCTQRAGSERTQPSCVQKSGDREHYLPSSIQIQFLPFSLLRKPLSGQGQHPLGSSGVTSDQLCPSYNLACLLDA